METQVGVIDVPRWEMMIMRPMSSQRLEFAAIALPTLIAPVSADDFSAVEHRRQTIYHSPQKPGYRLVS